MTAREEQLEACRIILAYPDYFTRTQVRAAADIVARMAEARR